MIKKPEDLKMEIEQSEYEHLKRKAEGNPKLCDGPNCDYQKVYWHKKWSWPHAKVGLIEKLTSLEFWFFACSTILFIVFAPKEKLGIGIWIAYFSLTALFIFFKPLSALIKKGKLNVEAKLGATASIGKTLNE